MRQGVGRYLRADPLDNRNNISNLYQYTLNRPVIFLDRLGLLEESCPYCPSGMWDIDIKDNLALAVIWGGSSAIVSFKCLSNSKECNGNLICSMFGISWNLSIGYSFEVHGEKGPETLGEGTIIYDHHSRESIKNYTTKSWVIAAGPVETSGNNLNVTAGASLWIGKSFCRLENVYCSK